MTATGSGRAKAFSVLKITLSGNCTHCPRWQDFRGHTGKTPAVAAIWSAQKR